MTRVYEVQKLEEMQKKDVEKDGARELAVGMLLDPRRWGEVKIQTCLSLLVVIPSLQVSTSPPPSFTPR